MTFILVGGSQACSAVALVHGRVMQLTTVAEQPYLASVTMPRDVAAPVDCQIDLLRLDVGDAGEILTLQRAAYVTEAQAHDDLSMPPLTQTLSQLRAELADLDVSAWGVREEGRLVASVRIRRADPATAEVGRLVVAPDRQGNGLGTALLLAAEDHVQSGITAIRLFTGERSHANQRLYKRLGYRETGRTSAGRYNLVHFTKALGGPGLP